MRHLATISDKSSAESFVAFLLTQGISTHVEPDSKDGATWDIWVRDEDKNQEAKALYDSYLESPNDPRYADALGQAKSILQEQKKKSIERRKNIHSTSLPNRNLFGGSIPPLTMTLVILCVGLGLVTWFSQPERNNWLGNAAMKKLSFVDQGLYRKTKDPAASIKQGELWRIWTPAFLHGHPIHLLLNMLSLVALGRIAERMEGIGKYALILVLVGLFSHLLQGLMPASLYGSPNFVGISGVVLGLLGYVGTKTTLRPDLGFQLSGSAYVMTGLLLLLGFTGGTDGIQMANMAHLGGLVGGILVGLLLSDKRFDHKA
jgi:GlpG protein